VPKVEGFLQEFAGLAFTTEMKYEVAPWLVGPPGSGKSTIIGGIQNALGSRVINLGLSDIERSRFALGKLPGKTLAISTEQPDTYIKASDVLNKIISGEPITVERKYREPFDVTSKVKFLWAMNELPRVPDANNGLFRRIKVIRFPRLSSAPDLDLKARIALEAPGILNWALAGLLRLMNRGRFDIPDCIIEATGEFQQKSDVPAVFVAEACLVGEGFKTRGQDLYEAYKVWCLKNGHKPESSTRVAGDWERMGFERKRTNAGTVYTGIGLLSPLGEQNSAQVAG
jgi:putative DNA primase/helicase